MIVDLYKVSCIKTRMSDQCCFHRTCGVGAVVDGLTIDDGWTDVVCCRYCFCEANETRDSLDERVADRVIVYISRDSIVVFEP